MISEETEDLPQGGQPVRTPRLGVVAAGGLSFLMSASLVVVAPVGLFLAPLALVPVVQWVSVDRRQGFLSWGWVVAFLVGLAMTGNSFFGSPAWAYLAAYALVVALPAASLDVWRMAGCAMPSCSTFLVSTLPKTPRRKQLKQSIKPSMRLRHPMP